MFLRKKAYFEFSFLIEVKQRYKFRDFGTIFIEDYTSSMRFFQSKILLSLLILQRVYPSALNALPIYRS